MKNWFWETIKSYFVRFFPLVVVFSGSLFNPGDSDMGWHLKYGEYFFQNHTILRENIFTSMMNGYKWVNSSWATDLITFSVFDRFGFWGLTILGALVITATFYFIAKAAKLSFWEQAILFPIVLNLEEPLFQVSFRGHLLSLLFISILIFLFKKYEDNRKNILLLILPVFVFWSNLHGEFILGLCIFALWTFLFFIRKYIVYNWSVKSQSQHFAAKIKAVLTDDWKYLLTIPVLSFFSVMINPFTTGVYMETIRHFDNPLQKYIVEWLPLDPFTPAWWKLIIWTVVITISVLLSVRQKQLVNRLPTIGIVITLTLMSFWMRRYAWAMFIVSVPLVRIFVLNFKPKSEKIVTFASSLFLIILYLYNVNLKIPSLGIAGMNWDNYCNWYVYCSPSSAQYLIDHPPKGKLLTFYNWGGWLVYKYPQIKTAIDGRMHLWRDENGYSAFSEYYGYEQSWTDVDKSDYDGVYINLTKPLYFQMVKLTESNKWEMVYKDDFAAVFYRIKKT